MASAKPIYAVAPIEKIVLEMTVEEAAHVQAFIGMSCGGPTSSVYAALQKLIPYGSLHDVDMRKRYESYGDYKFGCKAVK